jgi:hypothetical protein
MQLLFLDITLYLLDLLNFWLTFLNILEWSRIYFHLHDLHISNNPKVELVKLLAQPERSIISTSNKLIVYPRLQASTTTFASLGW